MSGGSFNYLYSKDANDLLEEAVAGTLEDMRVNILANVVDKVYPDETRLVVDEIESVQEDLKAVKKLQERIDQRMQKLSPVLRAVEWLENNDGNKKDVVEEVKKFVLAKIPNASY